MDYKKPQSTLVQGGKGIYPLTTADQVILADGSRLEKDGKISADSAANSADSAKLGGRAPEYYLQPRNLLDNSDFRNPVNQRGKTSYTGFAYTIDRWIIWSTTGTAKLEKANDYLFVNPNGESGCSISQRIPKGLAEQSKTYTKVLCHLDGSIKVSTAEIMYGDNYDLVDFHITSAANIVWAALYEGSYTADTIPPYVPKGYATELAECRRYFRRLPSYTTINAIYIYSTYARGVLPLEPMRIVAPSVSVNGQCDYLPPGGDWTSFTPSGLEAAGNSIIITHNVAQSATAGYACFMRASLDISADL